VPDVYFDILGVGDDESMLKELARKLGVADRVRFVGHVDHKDMPAYLHKADIFIRPSRSEGQGASFIEAMAAGLPVIATQVGGIADFLFDAKRNPEKPATGYAVAVDSPEHIAEAIKEIMDNPQEAERVAERAKKLALEDYQWDRLAKRMREEVFGPLLN
jgi:glycosyltransferase involved in cell wall biosynthesis